MPLYTYIGALWVFAKQVVFSKMCRDEDDNKNVEIKRLSLDSSDKKIKKFKKKTKMHLKFGSHI